MVVEMIQFSSGSQEPLFVYVKRTGTDSDRFTVFRKKTVACRCGFLLVFP
jgi:hypothetical protein